MNEERGPPIGGFDSLVVFLLNYIFYNNINCLCYELSCACDISTSIIRFLTLTLILEVDMDRCTMRIGYISYLPPRSPRSEKT